MLQYLSCIVVLDSVLKYSEITVDESLKAVLLVFQSNRSVVLFLYITHTHTHTV